MVDMKTFLLAYLEWAEDEGHSVYLSDAKLIYNSYVKAQKTGNYEHEHFYEEIGVLNPYFRKWGSV